MPAIVRQSMSRSLAKDLLQDIKNSANEYYIGIAKSDSFNEYDTVVDPIDCDHDEREFRSNLQSIKKVEDASFAAKRVNWSSGSEYSGWDDTIASDIVEPWTPWYVLNDAKEVYICLVSGTNLDGTSKQSVVEPNFGLLNVDYLQPFTTADGYTWKFLYMLTPENIFQFLSSNHIPVQEAEDSLAGGDAIEDLQFNVSAGAIGGQITRAKISNTGSGHVSPPQVVVHGNGSNATAVAEIDAAGYLTRILMTNYGSGYTYASFEIIGGTTTGSAVPVITSATGIGYNPIHDLKTSSILSNIKPDGDVGGTFITLNTFRQMGLLKNPIDEFGAPYVDSAVKTLPSLTLVNTSPFEIGKEITGTQSGSKAYVNQSVGAEVFYHQNESTGYKPFLVGEAVVQVGLVLTGDIASLSPINGIDRFSGEVLYIENRARIRRDPEQQEDIKIVITV